MKRIYFTLTLILLTFNSIIGQDSIYVYKNGAVNSKFAISLVDSLTFSPTLDSLIMSNNGTVTNKLPFAAFDSISFQPPMPSGSFRDIDGNIYTTVKIGTQTWMLENLKTTRYRNGDPIPNITSSSEWSTLSTGAYSDYDNNPANSVKYGRLYNWFTVNDSRNIAPAGWHVPTLAEWSVLETYLISNGFNYDGTKLLNKIAKSLASKTDWRGSGGAGAPGNNPSWNNSTNFTALPAGGRFGATGVFFSRTEAGFWWAKEETTNLEANYRAMFYGDSFFLNFVNTKNIGFSVRLIKSDVPNVTTNAVQSVTINSALSGGNVISDNNDPVTVRGVCWNTTGNPTVINDKSINGNGKGSFGSTLSDLAPGTTYYVRAYATNSAGTGYGNELNFTTLATLPSVSTKNVTNITANAASSGGQILTDGGATISAKGVCWSINKNPTLANSITNDGTGKEAFTSQLTKLSAGTKYYVRAYATNEIGTSYGEQITFTTLDLAKINTIAANEVTDSSAVVGGVIVSNGGDSILVKGICWSTNELPTINDSIVTNSIDSIEFTGRITGLNPAIKYFARAFATNSVGTAYGEAISFTTLASKPALKTVVITEITDSSAMTGGSNIYDGGSAIIAKGICWSTVDNPTINDSLTIDGDGTEAYVSTLKKLSPGTLYFVRAYATNAIGTSYGNLLTFTTLALPVVTTNEISEITLSSALSGGAIISDGGTPISARGVCWSTTEQPTIDENPNKTIDGEGIGGFTSTISGLSPSTTYYLRAYAINSIGTSYGNQVSFTTTALQAGLVFNHETGKIWMDKNLGATQVATSSNDIESFGHLFQWGRNSDGHEIRTSQTTNTLSTIETTNHGQFITIDSVSYDWLSLQNDNLWQGVNGSNNPCPDGYRIPTSAEWEAERNSWNSNNSNGAFSSPLKLSMAGGRYCSTGNLFAEGNGGYYWSSTVNGTSTKSLNFTSNSAGQDEERRANGLSVRCIKE